jgi:hypothetical protein
MWIEQMWYLVNYLTNSSRLYQRCVHACLLISFAPLSAIGAKEDELSRSPVADVLGEESGVLHIPGLFLLNGREPGAAVKVLHSQPAKLSTPRSPVAGPARPFFRKRLCINQTQCFAKF